MVDLTVNFSLEKHFGIEMIVVNNEILELSVTIKGTLNGEPQKYRSLIYEKPWEDYLTPEELKEFMEMDYMNRSVGVIKRKMKEVDIT
jgi:hypothetical protein